MKVAVGLSGLYDLSDELTEKVVAHAVARAGTSAHAEK